MIDARQRVVVRAPVLRIVEVRQGGRVAEIRQAAARRLEVLAFGMQGPIGTLDANVLQRVLQVSADAEAARGDAERAGAEAIRAAQSADEAVATVNDTIAALTSAFTYYEGALGAQEGA